MQLIKELILYRYFDINVSLSTCFCNHTLEASINSNENRGKFWLKRLLSSRKEKKLKYFLWFFCRYIYFWALSKLHNFYTMVEFWEAIVKIFVRSIFIACWKRQQRPLFHSYTKRES